MLRCAFVFLYVLFLSASGVMCWSPCSLFLGAPGTTFPTNALAGAVQLKRSSDNNRWTILQACAQREVEKTGELQEIHPLVPELVSRRCLLGQAAGIALGISTPLTTPNAAELSIETSVEPSTFGVPPPSLGTKRIFLCRHGQTEYNRLNLMQGRRVDAPLNENGARQAELLGNAVSDETFALIASSSLLRAKQTADAVQRIQRGKPPARLVLPELDEIDFGEVDGMDVSRARATMGSVYMQWIAGVKDARAPGGESFREIEGRCREGVGKLIAACDDGGAVLAVTHSALIRCYLAVSLDLPYAKAKALSQPNCCVNVLDVTAGGRVEGVRLGDTRHLPPELVTVTPRSYRDESMACAAQRADQQTTASGLMIARGGM